VEGQRGPFHHGAHSVRASGAHRRRPSRDDKQGEHTRTRPTRDSDAAVTVNARRNVGERCSNLIGSSRGVRRLPATRNAPPTLPRWALLLPPPFGSHL